MVPDVNQLRRMPSKFERDADEVNADEVYLRADRLERALHEIKKAIVPTPDNTNSPLSIGDHISYGLENRISANGWFPLILLGLVTSGVLGCLGAAWYNLAKDVPALVIGQNSLADSVFTALNFIISAGYTDVPDENGLRWLYFVSIFFGLVVFAVLVGFITDAVSQFMDGLAAGRTKVAAERHTLILGWNEATLRAVVQIAFLRRQYQMLNERRWFFLYYLPALTPMMRWLNVLEVPSTSLAVSDIVIMDDSISKDQMHEELEQTMAERGIVPWRTKIGRDVICRVGNPTKVNDLLRVGAHRAAAILVMMTEYDQREETESNGRIFNGATLRTTLALRHTLFTNPYRSATNAEDNEAMNPDLRIVLQMQHPSDYVDAACWQHGTSISDDGMGKTTTNGADVVLPMDLSLFLNSLMFKCAAQPGLSWVLMEILGFEGYTIRRRIAKNLRSGPDSRRGDCIGRPFWEVRREFTKAVFIGIVRPSVRNDQITAKGFGLCPDPNIVIEPDDLLIFLGPRSSPEHSQGMKETFEGYHAEAVRLREKYPEIADPTDPDAAKIQANVLVCGWREMWTLKPSRLHSRIMEIVRQRLKGSTITFINSVGKDDFRSVMERLGLAHVEDVKDGPQDVAVYGFEPESEHHGVMLRHIEGDAATTDVLSPVIMKNTIHTAIVLGTQETVHLGPSHRDTRVLNILLLLRKLWSLKYEGVPMHIVGENNEDMTALLALAPKRLGSRIRKEPDFVNSQAVSARALVQTLAYPMIQPAIKDLFDDAPSSADIVTVMASEYVPLDVVMKYGVVRAAVLRAKPGRSICIGIIWKNGEKVLVPPHDDDVCFCAEDRLIVFRRAVTDGIMDREALAFKFAGIWMKRALGRGGGENSYEKKGGKVGELVTQAIAQPERVTADRRDSAYQTEPEGALLSGTGTPGPSET